MFEQFDAILVRAHFSSNTGKYAGRIYADKKERFADGDYVYTSTLKDVDVSYGVFANTMNSRYLIVNGLDFQKDRTLNWLKVVFDDRNNDREERILRLLEEVMELAQAEGVKDYQVAQLQDQVFNKPVGEISQELGGVLVTLGSYLACTNQDPNMAYEREFARCEQPELVEKIRKKHDEKLVVSSKLR
jgi:NTP pyrophosphatase (non-canonical NTP hydrolase)